MPGKVESSVISFPWPRPICLLTLAFSKVLFEAICMWTLHSFPSETPLFLLAPLAVLGMSTPGEAEAKNQLGTHRMNFCSGCQSNQKFLGTW